MSAIPAENGAFARLKSALGRTLTRVMDLQSRTGRVNRLAAMSDRDLGRMGLARSQIIRHVYRDIYYI